MAWTVNPTFPRSVNFSEFPIPAAIPSLSRSASTRQRPRRVSPGTASATRASPSWERSLTWRQPVNCRSRSSQSRSMKDRPRESPRKISAARTLSSKHRRRTSSRPTSSRWSSRSICPVPNSHALSLEMETKRRFFRSSGWTSRHSPPARSPSTATKQSGSGTAPSALFRCSIVPLTSMNLSRGRSSA